MNAISYLFESFLKCPTKCYLRSVGEAGSGNAYAEWVQAQNDAYRGEATKRRMAELPEAEVVVAPPATETLRSAKWRLALDLPVQAGDGETRLQAVERVPPEGRGKPSHFIPIRFVFFNKLTKDDRLLLAYDALILSEALGREVSVAKIIHGDDYATLSVKIPGLMGEVRKIKGQIAALLATSSAPDLILIRHCTECEFRDRCRQKAVEKDDLSILSGVTEKERKRLHRKGIFTVTQLSYTFRPKRPRKRVSTRQDKYCPALKALAIREAKLHIIGSAELKLEGTPVYFDVEALPDRDFYYLIGAMVETPNGFEQRNLWADRIEDEAAIWADFLNLLAGLRNPILVHYGSFEAAFLKRMCSRYGGPSKDLASVVKAVEQPFNLLSFVFGHVYFPTYTNGLKDIGKFAGAKWQASDASGIQSLVWRYQWEETHRDDLKQKLLVYNRDDCQAVRLLTSELGQIAKMADSRRDVDYAYDPKRQATEQGAAIHGSFKAILASACANYKRSRIHLGKRKKLKPTSALIPEDITDQGAQLFGEERADCVSAFHAKLRNSP